MIGYVNTRINYDVLSYLPDHLETVKGQDIMVDEFGMGAFSMVIVEDMQPKDVVKLKEQIEQMCIRDRQCSTRFQQNKVAL